MFLQQGQKLSGIQRVIIYQQGWICHCGQHRRGRTWFLAAICHKPLFQHLGYVSQTLVSGCQLCVASRISASRLCVANPYTSISAMCLQPVYHYLICMSHTLIPALRQCVAKSYINIQTMCRKPVCQHISYVPQTLISECQL